MLKRFLPAAAALLGYAFIVGALAFVDWRAAGVAAGLALIYEAREAER